MKKFLHLILLMSVSLVAIQGCEKADDGTVWVSTDPCRQIYWQGETPKQHLTHFFKELGVEILEVKTFQEFHPQYDGPHTAGPCPKPIYCRIYREHLPIMQGYGFKLVNE